MNTDDMRKLYEGLKIIFEDQTPETKEPLNGNQEASSQEGKETGQEEANNQEGPNQEGPSQEAGANRVPENDPSTATNPTQPGANPGTEPTGGTEPNPGTEDPAEPNADETGEETSGPQEEDSDSSSEEEKEGFSNEEINQAVTIAEQLGLPQEPVENLFSLIDRDKLVNNNGEIGEEELTNPLKLLEAIVLRKPAKTPTEPNYNYDPENARQSTGFGKYL